MKDDLDTTHTRMEKLAHLVYRVLITPPEGLAGKKRMIQLVCRALQTAANGRQRIGTAKHQLEAADIAALHRWIVERAREAGLRITDDNPLR
jgi:hypothetical protein